MLSDKEKKAIELLEDYLICGNKEGVLYINLRIILRIIEKQSKEIEELKEDRKKYAEEYIHNNPWLYKQLNENYILRVESEQKERKAYIKGTNDAHELCNKKWKDKIKAKIEPKLKELDEQINEEWKKYGNSKELQDMEDMYNFLQSLLEKE